MTVELVFGTQTLVLHINIMIGLNVLAELSRWHSMWHAAPDMLMALAWVQFLGHDTINP